MRLADLSSLESKSDIALITIRWPTLFFETTESISGGKLWVFDELTKLIMPVANLIGASAKNVFSSDQMGCWHGSKLGK